MDWLPFRHKTQQGTELFPEKVRAPPVMEITLEASDKWNALGGENINVMVRQVLDANAGEIMQFFNAQQHMHSLGVSPSSYVERELAQLRLRYENNTGAEKLIIIVKPISPNPSVRVIQPSANFVIEVPFTGWPVAGYQYSQQNPGFATNLEFGPYLPDPQFVPNSFGAVDPDISDMAPGTLLGSNNYFSTMYGSVSWVDGAYNSDPFMTYNDNGGFTAPWQTSGVGVLGACVRKLEGQQYWEVKIDALPSSYATPSPITVFTSGGVYDGTFISSNVLYWDSSRQTQNWDPMLTTFFTPYIGVVSDYYIDPGWRKNTIVYGNVAGLDPLEITARSIGVMNTSVILGSETTRTWVEGFMYYESETGYVPPSVPAQYVVAPEQSQQAGVLAWLNQYTGPTNPYDPPDPPDMDLPVPWETLSTPFGNGRRYTVVVNQRYVLFGDVQTDVPIKVSWIPTEAEIAGALDANIGAYLSTNPPPPDGLVQQRGVFVGGHFQNEPIDYNGIGPMPPKNYSGVTVLWSVEAIVNDPYAGMEPGSPGTLLLGQFPFALPRWRPGHYHDETKSMVFGDGLATPDVLNMDGSYGAAGLTAPGKRAPVIKGRYDAVGSVTASYQDLDIATTNSHGVRTNGVWTGVDLGVLQVDDVVMIATDQKTREIWFGKNGKWYDTSGPTDLQPGAKDFKAATYLDGDHTVPYYPACSVRLGPTKLVMQFGTGQKYTPPGNFTSYGALPSITLPE